MEGSFGSYRLDNEKGQKISTERKIALKSTERVAKIPGAKAKSSERPAKGSSIKNSFRIKIARPRPEDIINPEKA